MEDSIWHTELSLITMITLFNYASWFTLFLKKKKKNQIRNHHSFYFTAENTGTEKYHEIPKWHSKK